jgi:hypothetical protein
VAAAAVLDVLVWVAHDDAHDATDTQVDLGLGRLPVVFGVEPAMEYLLAGPRVEDRLGGRVEGPLNSERRCFCHVRVIAGVAGAALSISLPASVQRQPLGIEVSNSSSGTRAT